MKFSKFFILAYFFIFCFQCPAENLHGFEPQLLTSQSCANESVLSVHSLNNKVYLEDLAKSQFETVAIGYDFQTIYCGIVKCIGRCEAKALRTCRFRRGHGRQSCINVRIHHCTNRCKTIHGT